MQEEFPQKALPMPGIALHTEAQAQRGCMAYPRSHRGKNSTEIGTQADPADNASLGLNSGL